MREDLSYGASAHRDGVNLAKQKKMMPLVFKHDIARLDDLAGYLKLKTRWLVARVKIPLVDMAVNVPAFVLKSDNNNYALRESNALVDLLFNAK